VSEARDTNPLVERVDALLKRHQDSSQKTEDGIPVLTEVIDPERGAAVTPPPGSDALAAQIEREVLEQLAPELHEMMRRVVRNAVLRALAAREAGKAGS